MRWDSSRVSVTFRLASVAAAGWILSGCGGDAAPAPDATAAPQADIVPDSDNGAAAATTPSADTSAGQSGGGLVRTDAQGRKWIGDIPYDVFFDEPLTVASQQTTIAPAAVAVTPTPQPMPTPTPMPQPMPQPAAGGGADWKQIIPVAALESEVKALRNQLANRLQSVGQFRREYKEVQWDGATLAAIGEIANRHPEAVSWKDQAKFVRHLGMQIEQAAQESDRESFDKAERLAEQLQVILSGGSPADLPADVPEQATFAETAGRYGMMKRINQAFSHLKRNVNTADRLKEETDSARHEAAMMAALAQAVADPGYLSAEEPEYQAQAQALLDAGLKAQAAAQSNDFAAYTAAVDAAAKTCAECHAQYRFE